MINNPASMAARMLRLAAACVRMAPILPPLCMLLGLAATGEARGMGGVGVLAFFYVWGALAALVTLVWLALDLLRFYRNQPSLAFTYAGIVLEGAHPARQASAAVLVGLGPPLAGWAASASCAATPTCSLDLENQLLWCVPFALWLINWLFWLSGSSRTLGDRLAGGRLSVQSKDADTQIRPRRWWPDALLLLPPVLALPLSGGVGGLVGLLVSLAVLVVPVWLTRTGVAFTPPPR